MAAVAHNPAFAKRVGIPQSVGKDFSEADKGRKFGSGGRADVQAINKPKTNHGASAFFSGGGTMKADKAMEMRHAAAMKKAGVPKKMVQEEEAEAAGMKRGGKTKKYAGGGFVKSADGIAQKGKTKAKQITMKRGGKC
jgi:hypothetical protein